MPGDAALHRVGVALVAGALALFLAGACMPEFDEEWEVKDLRILGIRAEPPELLLSEPTPPLVTVDALVVNPAAPPERLYYWELWICTPGGELCDGASLRYLLRRDRTTLDQIRHRFYMSEGLQRQTVEIFEQWGIEAGRVPLRVELRVFQDHGPVVRGLKRVYLEEIESPGQQAISNPRLERVVVDGEPLAGPIRIAPCRSVEVLAWVEEPADETEGRAEFFEEYTSQGSFTTRMSAVAGGWMPAQAGEPDGLVPPGLSMVWNPCGASDLAHLWIVVRNGWGGIDWQELQARTR
jgi:hypothetical protein